MAGRVRNFIVGETGGSGVGSRMGKLVGSRAARDHHSRSLGGFRFSCVGGWGECGAGPSGGWALALATAAPELHCNCRSGSRSGCAKDGRGDQCVKAGHLAVLKVDFLVDLFKVDKDRFVRLRACTGGHRFLEADDCPSHVGVARTVARRSQRRVAARIRAPAALG